MSTDKIVNNKMEILGKLTASLIHELRNPLSAVKLNLDYLKMLKDELPDHINETVDSTGEALERINYLIENIFDFSRQSLAGNMPCQINKVTRKAVDIIKGTLSRESLTIDISLDDHLPLLLCNENKLLQVFLNLITNAIEACEGPGKIFIKSYRDKGKDIFWSVRDTGVGIKQDEQDKIFEDFFTKKSDGTGLGLSVCNRLLKDMDAELSFKSEEGKSSTFYIKFNPEKIVSAKHSD
ncbi:MAG: HAMP domain-containing histidine kinase [Bacteroidetes bacterium]|nr:HAMP domain-containing histidine kinase [Bacteroidota bacterium]